VPCQSRGDCFCQFLDVDFLSHGLCGVLLAVDVVVCEESQPER
jgi:hypothetical protein